MDRRLAGGLGAADRLAVNGHLEPFKSTAHSLHPADKAGLEDRGVEQAEHATKGMMGRDAVSK